jgi:hypothetical protein
MILDLNFKIKRNIYINESSLWKILS